jgi:hypothetical protein
MFQRLAFEQFHGDEGATLEFADVINSADVGVIERRRGAGFAAKALDGLGVLRNIVGKKFQGHVAAQARVLGFINDAHTSAAQFFHHVVVGDGAADDGGSIGHRRCSLR